MSDGRLPRIVIPAGFKWIPQMMEMVSLLAHVIKLGSLQSYLRLSFCSFSLILELAVKSFDSQ
jgi:hypothetical protein